MRVIHSTRYAYLIVLLLIAALAGIMALPPIAQDPMYHVFADRRDLIGISSFFNVATNLAFLAVGIAGFGLCARQPHGLGARRAWIACFTGVALVSLGSGYYHLAPDDSTLMWDRLPMSVVFMALSVAVLSEYVNPRLEKYLLVPAIALGLASVIAWHYTGDLRLYVLVQFLPLLMLPAVLFLYNRPGQDRGYLLASLAIYMVAKLAEYYDGAIFTLTGEIISGHSLKHLLAAVALFVVYRMLKRRTLLTS
jgi:Ceramidase